jgi:hypothetical protein
MLTKSSPDVSSLKLTRWLKTINMKEITREEQALIWRRVEALEGLQDLALETGATEAVLVASEIKAYFLYIISGM